MSSQPKKVFVAGHNGMVGSAIVRKLSNDSSIELITMSRNELDLNDQREVHDFFQSTRIDEVYLAAAKVGGIHANNSFPADFIYQNIMLETNIINSAHETNVNKLLFLGSSCIYPKLASQPMKEEALLTGPLESTNEPYAVAKIAGIKLCESYNRQHNRDYRSVMPTNLYGDNDNFHPENSHVIPGLLRRFHEAKINGDPEVKAWGSGNPKREFLHVNDMADACIHVMGLSKEQYDQVTSSMCSHINVGTGEDCSIRNLVTLVAKVVGYEGVVSFDSSKPDGAPRKLLDVERLRTLGWTYSIDLERGLKQTYDWFLLNQDSFRG